VDAEGAADELIDTSIRSTATPGSRRGRSIRAGYRDAGIIGPQAASDWRANVVTTTDVRTLSGIRARRLTDPPSEAKKLPIDPLLPGGALAPSGSIDRAARRAERPAPRPVKPMRPLAPREAVPVVTLEQVRELFGEDAFVLFSMIERGMSVAIRWALLRGWVLPTTDSTGLVKSAPCSRVGTMTRILGRRPFRKRYGRRCSAIHSQAGRQNSGVALQGRNCGASEHRSLVAVRPKSWALRRDPSDASRAGRTFTEWWWPSPC